MTAPTACQGLEGPNDHDSLHLSRLPKDFQVAYDILMGRSAIGQRGRSQLERG